MPVTPSYPIKAISMSLATTEMTPLSGKTQQSARAAIQAVGDVSVRRHPLAQPGSECRYSST
ncbi:hypothetical protein [Candidatus Phyllobacterium onerii]|uniref:hypothetical protein n=1 Tax=Candidatus Phyllobacterium onerii TaxID=3020828 RepID=UPI00232C7003|nr:hypothetical protein [Phyllobacterium sp. IY22]